MATTKATTLAHTIASTTSSTADLDYAKTLNDTGVTSTEFDILDGVTADATDINRLDITTEGTSQASKVVTADSSSNITLSSSAKLKIGSTGGIYRSNGTTPIIVDTSAINEPEARLGELKHLPSRVTGTSTYKGTNLIAKLQNININSSYSGAVGISSASPGFQSSDGSYNTGQVKGATSSGSTNYGFIVVEFASNVNVDGQSKAHCWIFQGGTSCESAEGHCAGTWTVNILDTWASYQKGLQTNFFGNRDTQYWGINGPAFTTRCDPQIYVNTTDKKMAIYWGLFDTYRNSGEIGNSVPWQGDVTFIAGESRSSGDVQSTNFITDIYVSNYLPGTNSNWSYYTPNSAGRSTYLG